MKFKVKLAEFGDGAIEPWWEEYDHPEVKTQRDAFAYGRVLCEYWNSDLRPAELPRKVVNAVVTGLGQKTLNKRKELPGQLTLFSNRRDH